MQQIFCFNRLCIAVFILMITSVAVAKNYCAIDDSGTTLCLKSYPRRIISLAPSATELLYAIGAAKQMLAVDQSSDFPLAAKKLPKVGGYPSISIEKVLSMNPDLVIVWPGGNSPQLIEQIEKGGVAIFRLNAVSLEGIAEDMRKLGAITGNAQKANVAADSFIRRLAHLKETYQHQRPISVFFEIWNSPLMSVGNNNFMNSLISLCGGQNIFADAGVRFPVISIESLLIRNPEVIIATSTMNQIETTQKSLANYWGKWPMLTAVKKKHIFVVNSDLISRPTLRILEGVEEVCRYLESVRKEEGERHE